MRNSPELVLGDEPGAVPKARRFTRSVLAGQPADAEAAELVVAELVTNAVLHGKPPVTLRLMRLDGRLRVEVQDTGRALPIRIRQGSDGMTGRGLSLVAAYAVGWGVEPAAGPGKVVWAELSERETAAANTAPEVDVDALLASWQDGDDDAGSTYLVALGAVPTDLLLAAKAHIDNVVRELMLAKQDEATGMQLAPPPAALIDTVTRDFAAARTEIKRQAVDAAARGDSVTDLVLHLPLTSADAGERYLTALDEVDRYARAERLLTMAAPRSHRIFRRWYVQALVDQLRALARGEPAPDFEPFPQVLADEVDRLSSLEDAWDRLQLLQKVTGELTGARSVTDIATTVVRNAREFLGADSARVYLLTADRMLRSVAHHGAGDPTTVARYDEVALDADLPGSVAVRTGRSVFLRSLGEINARFPQLAGYYPTERSLHVAPLIIGDDAIGVLSLTFLGTNVDEDTQVTFVRALADALAQAVERARAIERAEAASERLSFLADASVALSASLDFEATLTAVAELLVPRLADWCAIQLLRDGTLETVALLHFDPARVKWAQEMVERYPVNMEATTGGPVVLRTGLSELYQDIPESLIEQAAINDDHLAIIREFGMSSGMVVPLTGRSGTFGVVTLIHAESGRHYAEADVTFVEDVARRAALALETADTFREQSGRLANVIRVAEAAQRAILAPPPARLGPVSLAARYVSAAAEALVGGDLYEIVQRPGAVRLLIGDVRGKGLSAVRTATVVLGEFRSAAADIDDLADAARQIDRRVRPYLAEEDFVTALLAEIADDGRYAVACCGHPPPLLVSNGQLSELAVDNGLPLGLGAAPTVSTGQLVPGDRLLLYTDGVIEARDSSGRFIDLMHVMQPIVAGALDPALDEVLAALHRTGGPELGDDVALLLAEYRP